MACPGPNVQAPRIAQVVAAFFFVALAANGIYPALAADVPYRIDVELDSALEPVNRPGRLLVFFTQRKAREPRLGPDWFSPEPFFAIDVERFATGDVFSIDSQASAYPDALDRIPAGNYRVQAVLHSDPDAQDHNHGRGNLASEVLEWKLPPTSTLRLRLKQRLEPPAFHETDIIRRVELESPLLSKFHGRPVEHLAAVVLPASYAANPDRRYGVVYVIPGFGGTHHGAATNALAQPRPSEQGTELIRVLVSGECGWGHHVFADSATNGPRGMAFVSEFVPYIDRTYRTVADPAARFVAGHSSGGWASLWLQITYPEQFGGVWSLSPDPVDFHDYQQVDLYSDPPSNMYHDAAGARRPLARIGTQPRLWYDDFTRMDDCLGRGGQLRSFEAVFSPLDQRRLPRVMYDRITGDVDLETARAWRAYDIAERIEADWARLRPLLAGKLHVLTGEFDSFYLEGAVRRLAARLQALGSDAQFEIVPKLNHFNIMTLSPRVRREMSQAFDRAFPALATEAAPTAAP